MNPYPFCGLNHFTVPVFMICTVGGGRVFALRADNVRRRKIVPGENNFSAQAGRMQLDDDLIVIREPGAAAWLDALLV